jgi:hypothetical protein
MMYAGDLSVVPSDCDRIPTRLGDDAAVIGITAPIRDATGRRLLRVRGQYSE